MDLSVSSFVANTAAGWWGPKEPTQPQRPANNAAAEVEQFQVATHQYNLDLPTYRVAKRSVRL